MQGPGTVIATPTRSLLIVHIVSFIHMFTATAIRTSDACRFISVDLLTGTAIVDFKDGNQYKYTNVSRRAIINLMMQPQMSLGFWANKNCVQADRTSYAVVADYAAA